MLPFLRTKDARNFVDLLLFVLLVLVVVMVVLHSVGGVGGGGRGRDVLQAGWGFFFQRVCVYITVLCLPL